MNFTENATVAKTGRDEELAQAEVATLSAMLVVTVLGNGAVLVALLSRRRWAGRRMYFFMAQLSAADLLNALLNVLPQLAWDFTFRWQVRHLPKSNLKYLFLGLTSKNYENDNKGVMPLVRLTTYKPLNQILIRPTSTFFFYEVQSG